MPQREEESLIDEMRQTIRADRERAAARVARTIEPPPAVELEPAPPPVEAAQKGLRARLFRRG